MLRPPGKPRASLVAAARAQPTGSEAINAPSSSTPNPSLAAPPDSADVPQSSSRTVSVEPRTSTPILPDASQEAPVAKLKFKPKVPIRRVKQELVVKPDVSAAAGPSRGIVRGRGRGTGTRGRGTSVASDSMAAGPLGRPRVAATSTPIRRLAPTPVPRGFDSASAEVYSDHSDQEGGKIIDIDAVSGLGESAPTSLFRDRNVREGKAKAKGEMDGKGKERVAVDSTTQPPGRVKAEPLSPVKRRVRLPDPNQGVLPPVGREDDVMMSDDEDQDRDARGRRVRKTGQIRGVNEAQKVDLSESESEEEGETMEGDFVPAPGYDNPQDKIFVFQFPNLFPQFEPSGPVDVTADQVKPDIKPTAAQLKPKKKILPPPEGRVGTMVIMKSGKVKIVLGNDIVMKVTPGVTSTFLQQLVHLDTAGKSAVVLGEVHKQYIVTPDIDILLRDLYLNGGATPGDKEAEARKVAEEVKVERRLVKMELE